MNNILNKILVFLKSLSPVRIIVWGLILALILFVGSLFGSDGDDRRDYYDQYGYDEAYGYREGYYDDYYYDYYEPYHFEEKETSCKSLGRSPYCIRNESVYYRGYDRRIYVTEDVKNFIVVSQYGDFAKDSAAVYAFGKKIDGAVPADFEIIGENEYDGTLYARSGNAIFYIENYEEGEIKKFGKIANPAEFAVLENNYVKDNTYVYAISSAQLVRTPYDPATLDFVSADGVEIYVKDKNGVYLNDQRIIDADPATFSSFDNYGFAGKYTKDIDSVFFEGKRIPFADPKTFKPLSRCRGEYIYAVDDTYAYYLDSIINGADPKTFEVSGGDFAKDANHVYWKGRVQSELNPADYLMKCSEIG